MQIKRATRQLAHVRIALVGPSGAGKTFTALRIARGLVGPEGRVCVIDTERGSASLYANEPDIAGEYDVLELTDQFSPDVYVKAIKTVTGAGYDVCVIDSLTHAWAGAGGALEMADDVVKRSRSGNSFTAWREVTPQHNKLVDTILQARCHVIVTMRVKTEWVLEKDEKTGKQVPRKIGLAPIQRAGMEYEFDLVADLDPEHNLVVSKSRCRALTDRVIRRPDGEIAAALRDWLSSGAPADAPAPEPAPESAPEPTPTPTTTPLRANTPAPAGAEAKVLRAYASQAKELVERLTFPPQAFGESIRVRYGVRKFADLDVTTASQVLHELKAVVEQWDRVVAAARDVWFADADPTDEQVAERARQYLEAIASETHQGRPLLAKPQDWQQWADELIGGSQNG
jgi:DNA polymerase III delta prime subunit